MKPLIILVLMGAFLAHSSSKAYFFRSTWKKEETINKDKGKNETNFLLIFLWQENVIITFNNREYHIAGGIIKYNFENKQGSLKLLTINRDQEIEKVQFDTPLTQSEFEKFATRYSTMILNPAFATGEITSTILTNTLKEQDLKDYNHMKDFIELLLPGLKISIKKSSWSDLFTTRYVDNQIKRLMNQESPGLTITAKKSSWFNWPTITWRHIVGAIGLGAAGYAYYKYYNAR
jgi:hypothetical protein